MKKIAIRFGWIVLLLAMTVGQILAQEGEAAEAASDDSNPALMIMVLVVGLAVIAGLGLAMNSQESAENDDK